MSTVKHNGVSTVTTESSADTKTFEADIAQLTSLLSDESSLESSSEADVAELLRRLESADGMARGIEARLDGMLGNLDSLLVSLESQAEAGVSDRSQSGSDSTK